MQRTGTPPVPETAGSPPSRPVPPFRFLGAFFAAPLVFTALTFWVGYISYFALVLGGPFYVLIGLPVLYRFLRRNPPAYLPIVLIAMISTLGCVPALLVAAWWVGEWELVQAIPFFLAYALVFAAIWGATFTLLYRLSLRYG